MRELFFCTLLVSFFSFTEVKDLRDIREECESRCDEDILMNYLASLEVLSPESIINLPIADLDPLCRKLDDHLKTIMKYLKTCRPPPPEDLFMSLIQGVKILNLKMCSAESEFLKQFILYYPCLHELLQDYEGCNGPADWNEETDDLKLCNSYKHIVDCYYVKTAKVCGLQAAKAVKEIAIEVINSVLCVRCSSVRNTPYVKDPMPEQYVRRNLVSCAEKPIYNSAIALLSLTLVII